jgi:hypothetical protein
MNIRTHHIAQAARRFFLSVWNSFPDHRPAQLTHIDHQFIQTSSSEFSMPSNSLDPRKYERYQLPPWV